MKRTQKLISIILMVTMLTGIISIFPVSVSATTKTQSEAVQWAKDQIGENLDWDGNGVWCVDLIRYYYNFLGEPCPGGDGCDYAWNALPDGWERIEYYDGFIAQPGDIAVWTYASTEDGHVAVVISADSSSMTVVDQRGQGHTGAGESTYRYTSMKFFGVLRPDFAGSSPHECNQNVYYSYWEAHPHYYLYKCSICGIVSTDYNQTRTIESCVDCNSYKPVLNVKPEGDGYINFTWNRSEDVDVYELKIYDSNEELRFHYTDIEYSNFSTEIPAGSYVAYVCVVDSISEDNIICSEGVAFTVDELGNTTATEHTHDYGITEEVASSCKNLGYTVFTCSCGDTYTSNHSAFGAHKAADEWTVIKLPTETESGIACRLCIYCNTQVEYQIIESGDIVTSPTTPPDATFPSDDSGNTYKYGDVDLNGKINIKDATAIQKNVAKITALGNTSLVAADVNADGKVNVKDATAIQKYLANIPVESRIGETFSATDNFYSLVVI